MSATQPQEQDRRARDERALFERLARGGDARARDELVVRFLPLARALALRYQHSHESLDDLLQVAALGLVKAIDGFDPERQIAFSSYAVPTILGELRRHFRDRTWAVRVPRNLQELSLRIDRTVEALAEQLRRQPRVAEIAVALGVDEEEVLEALQARGAYRALSFDAPRGGDEEATTLADSIGVGEDGFERAEQRATLAALLGLVTPRERDVLRLRFEEDMTQAEIGAIIGVSQMQISRIIRRAVERLRVAGDRAATGAAPRPMH
ncbi:MAG TPA: SigB/SigF/SigG family RNA polymerase sigma factor [Solirubrobacteraceae bacterium]|jgi:RNA polymerase sigma-B factor